MTNPAARPQANSTAAPLPALPWGEGFVALTVLFLILAAL